MKHIKELLDQYNTLHAKGNIKQAGELVPVLIEALIEEVMQIEKKIDNMNKNLVKEVANTEVVVKQEEPLDVSTHIREM